MRKRVAYAGAALLAVLSAVLVLGPVFGPYGGPFDCADRLSIGAAGLPALYAVRPATCAVESVVPLWAVGLAGVAVAVGYLAVALRRR